MATNSIQNNFGSQADYRPGFLRDRRSEVLRGNGPGENVRAAKVELSSEKTRTLELTTDDGDTVTISIETSAHLEAGGFKTKGPNGRTLGGSISGGVDVSVNVEVTGELDAEELADISKLLQDLVRTGNPAPKPAEPPVVAAPPASETPVSLPPVTETEVVVAAEPDTTDTGTVETLPVEELPPPVEDDGTSIAVYAYNETSSSTANFSRIHNRATWG